MTHESGFGAKNAWHTSFVRTNKIIEYTCSKTMSNIILNCSSIQPPRHCHSPSHHSDCCTCLPLLHRRRSVVLGRSHPDTSHDHSHRSSQTHRTQQHLSCKSSPSIYSIVSFKHIKYKPKSKYILLFTFFLTSTDPSAPCVVRPSHMVSAQTIIENT